MKKGLLIFSTCISLLLGSCFKEEKTVPRKDRGAAITEIAEMGSDYASEIYFSLLTKKNIKSVGKFSWDIGLSGSSSKPYIVLNSSKSMYAYKTDKNSLLEIKDTIGKLGQRLNDYPCGSPDSLALSGILQDSMVYIIDLGYDESFQKAGFLLLKAQVLNGSYLVEYSNIDGSNYRSKTISFDANSNLLFYNFKTTDLLPEPPFEEWELLFTQYQHVYYNPFQTYSVVGCLINQSTTMACEYKGNKAFNEIQVSDTLDCTFSNRRDIIGFSWKYFDLNNNQYIINSKKTYFVKRRSGNIYKLHFINFYSSTGVKGTATFEFQEL